MPNYIKAFISKVKLTLKRSQFPEKEKAEEFLLPKDVDFCHKETVHIFVRGLADGKMHVARNRNYSDFRFYKKDNLKVFCAVCRKRIV